MIVVVVTLGIFFRVVNLDKKIYWVDETYTSLWLSGYSQTEVIEQIYDKQPIGIEVLKKYQKVRPEKSYIDTIDQLEPQHPPLYYVLARFWNQCFGNSPAGARSFSAFISVLTIPCLYWLCKELFSSNLTAWMAVTLFAISPLHLLYAQEARQYSLWTMVIILSSLALLRALRLHDRVHWCVYAVSVALSLYTSINSIFVIVGYGIYIVFKEGFKPRITLIKYTLASLAGILAFLPWLIKLNEINAAGWTGQDFGVWLLAGKWISNTIRIFFDFVSFDSSTPLIQLLPLIPSTLALLFLIGYSIYYLIKNSQKEVWLFVLTLILTLALALALPDILLGGRRSGVARYLMPSFLGIQLAVAFLLSNKITSFRQQKLWRLVTVGLVSAGIISCITISQAEIWWNKGSISSEDVPKIASIIDRVPNQLIISDTDLIHILSLSHEINSNAQFLLLSKPNLLDITAVSNFNNVFLFEPSRQLQNNLEQQHIYKYILKPIYPLKYPKLWRLEIKEKET
jgi:uncharacterized membrane protein